MKEDKESWRSFLVWLKERGLDGVKLVVGDKNLGMCKSVHEVFPDAKYQRCTVHFYRNIMSSVPRNRFREVAYEREALSKRTSNQSFSIAKSDWEQSQLSLMLKAIHAQENKEAARKKAREVIEKLKKMKLISASKNLDNGIEETFTHMDFPSKHWLKIRTNNVIERLNREIRRRTRVVGAFPDGNSALMLVCARLRYVAGKDWGCKRYLCMKYLDEAAE